LTETTPESVLRDLQPIFEAVLDEPELTVTRSSSAWNTPNWDSLAHIDLVQAIEHRFKVRFSLNELQHLKEVGDIVDLVIRKSAAG